ncbi:uncharacterized protein LOC125385208 isoform X4 [Bombus terrestris]|nr:uncharacterized protein LOC125385208 isoform X4 [Bombus terrestris]
MLDGGIIQRLLEEKWKTFARLQFLKRLIILVFHLTSLSLAVYMRPSNIDATLLEWPEEITEVGRMIAECTTVIGVLSYILVQLGGEVVNIGLLSFMKQLSHEPAKLIFLISNLLILACIPCRLAGNRHAEDAILVVAVPGSWFLLMFFAGAIRLTGPFVTMVYSMITGDMLTFGIIYMVVLFGFCQSFYFLYKGFPGVKSSLYSSYHSTWMALFQITLGDYNWAKIVVSLERAVAQKDAQNYLQEYSIKLGPGDDPNNPASEQRGVLVIKSKSKTKAKQRKGAVANWKRVGKVTINELKKRGITGEALRRVMWGRASFSTPVRTSPNTAEPQVSAVTAGFGDALTAALDVVAFAHDLDLSTATEGIPTNNDAKQSKSKTACKDQVKSATNNKEKVSTNVQQQRKLTTENLDNLASSRNDIDKISSEFVAVREMNSKNASHSSMAEDFQDPLLELVIASENTDDPETLLKIAERAAANFEVESSSKINLQILEQFTMTKLPMEEKVAATKKQYFVESSDNDFGGDNLLGTEARLRRIRSANNRFITTRRRSRHTDDDLSSTSSTSADRNPQYQPLLNGPENLVSRQIESRESSIEAIKPQVKQNGSCDSVKIKVQKRRPKTAKNRVSPKEIEEAGPRRRESIERNKAVSPATSPTDPLEPWSTRGIKDMNTILAWEENTPDSP